jgi:hypothetical protein
VNVVSNKLVLQSFLSVGFGYGYRCYGSSEVPSF